MKNEGVPFRPRRLTVWAAAVAVVATILIAVVAPLRFAYTGPGVHVAIATAVSLIGLLAAGLVLGRYRRSRRLQDLALTAALLILSGTNFFFSCIRAAFGEVDSQVVAWAPFIGRMAGALIFALSVAVPDREVRDVRRATLGMFAACIAVLALVAGLVAWLSPDWGRPLADHLMTTNSGTPHLT